MAKIDEIRDRLRGLAPMENRMNSLRERLRAAEGNVAALLTAFEKEKRDVEHMQQEGFSAFLYCVIGKYDDKLEKERVEEIAAKERYDRAAADTEELRWEIAELGRKIADLHRLAGEYERELNMRREALRSALSTPAGQRYRELEEERRDLVAQLTEVGEAARVAARTKSTAQGALRSLESAEDWATFDVFSNSGIITHAAKYSHIDEAEAAFHRLGSQLRELRAELGDVRGLTAPGLSPISSGQRAVDFWFDNIFTDLSVRSQIQDNIGSIRQILAQLGGVDSALAGKHWELETRLLQNRAEEEALLVSMKE